MGRAGWSRRAALAAVAAGLAGCSGGDGGSAPATTRGTLSVEEATSRLARYRDVGEALADGYRNTFEYTTAEGGGVGIQFINPEVREVDAAQPPVLLYDMADDGTYRLAGARWLRTADAADAPPTLFGREFRGPVRTGDGPRHYQLTAWLFVENPEGRFAPANPALSRPGFLDDVETARSALGSLGSGQAARDAGYESVGSCEDGTGFRFRAPVDGLSPEEPPVLFYAPTPEGTLSLSGAGWTADADGEPPTLFGQSFEGPTDGRYELRAWLFETNPEGLFARTNPRVSCQPRA